MVRVDPLRVPCDVVRLTLNTSTLPTHIKDEPEFLDKLRVSDPVCLNHLVLTNTPWMFALAFKMLHNRDDAQDAVQEAFVNVCRAIGDFDGRAALTTWLHRIVITTCLMKMRKRRRTHEVSVEALLPTFLPDGHQTTDSKSWKPNPSSGIESIETTQLLRKQIDLLPPEYREILTLRDVLGLSTEETAQLLDSSIPLVKTRLHRARQALKTLLDPYFS